MTFRKLALLFLMILAVHVQAAPPRDRLTTLDGKSYRARIRKITPAGKVVFAERKNTADLQNLRNIRRPIKLQKSSGATSIVHLPGEGQIIVRSVRIHKSHLEINSRGIEPWRLPLRYVRGLWCPTGKDHPTSAKDQFRQLLTQKKRTDRALAVTGEGVKAVRCAVLGLDGERLKVEYEGEKREIRREKLIAIVLAATTNPPDRTGHCQVTLKNSSKIWGKILHLKGNKLKLEAFPGNTIAVRWDHVHKVAVRSERMVFASDLEPISAVQGAIATYPWSYRKDRNVLNNPLTLGG
ncbi:MAG: hypothetical protein KGZ25_10605, partial [Planctomycetes bacterium]|nr:hypothetical protein [Planctomycetota bacterium]